jgi:hypothetical protein
MGGSAIQNAALHMPHTDVGMKTSLETNMNKSTRTTIFVTLLLLTGAALIAVGVNQVYKQLGGVSTQANITVCTKIRRTYVCHGSWWLNGKLVSGEIENADDDDLHQKIEIKVVNDKAIKPGYRVPAILTLLGLFFIFGGVRFAMGKPL